MGFDMKRGLSQSLNARHLHKPRLHNHTYFCAPPVQDCMHQIQRSAAVLLYTLACNQRISDSSEAPTASPDDAVRACRYLNAPGIRPLQTGSLAQSCLTPHRLPLVLTAIDKKTTVETFIEKKDDADISAANVLMERNIDLVGRLIPAKLMYRTDNRTDKQTMSATKSLATMCAIKSLAVSPTKSPFLYPYSLSYHSNLHLVFSQLYA